jgi:hypothetical protein
VCYPLTPNSASSKLDPNYARAFANRGIVYGRTREYDRAIQDFDQAIRLDPDLALAFYGRGIAHYDKREFDQAIQDGSVSTCARWRIPVVVGYAAARFTRTTCSSTKQRSNTPR